MDPMKLIIALNVIRQGNEKETPWMIYIRGRLRRAGWSDGDVVQAIEILTDKNLIHPVDDEYGVTWYLA